jgi:hypothetical protein
VKLGSIISKKETQFCQLYQVVARRKRPLGKTPDTGVFPPEGDWGKMDGSRRETGIRTIAQQKWHDRVSKLVCSEPWVVRAARLEVPVHRVSLAKSIAAALRNEAIAASRKSSL